jgi:hypothetical protein
MIPAGVDRAGMRAQPLEHHRDVALGTRSRADFLDAHIVHVEDAVALEISPSALIAHTSSAKRCRPPSPLDEIEIGFQRRPEPENDDVIGNRFEQQRPAIVRRELPPRERAPLSRRSAGCRRSRECIIRHD